MGYKFSWDENEIGIDVLIVMDKNNCIFCALQLGGSLFLLPPSCWFLPWLPVQPSRWRRHVTPKRLLTYNELHDDISHKTEFFRTTQSYV
jgi:hypothetical protein